MSFWFSLEAVIGRRLQTGPTPAKHEQYVDPFRSDVVAVLADYDIEINMDDVSLVINDADEATIWFEVFVTIQVPTQVQATTIRDAVKTFPCGSRPTGNLGCFWHDLETVWDNQDQPFKVFDTGGEPQIVWVPFVPPSAPPATTTVGLESMGANQEVAGDATLESGVIAGIAVGSVALLGLVGLCIYLYMRSLRSRYDKANQVMLRALEEGPGGPVAGPGWTMSSSTIKATTISKSEC